MVLRGKFNGAKPGTEAMECSYQLSAVSAQRFKGTRSARASRCTFPGREGDRSGPGQAEGGKLKADSYLGRGAFALLGRSTGKTAGAERSENAGMSSDKYVRTVFAVSLRFPTPGQSASG